LNKKIIPYITIKIQKYDENLPVLFFSKIYMGFLVNAAYTTYNNHNSVKL